MRESEMREKIRVDRGGCDARGSAAEFNNNFSNENYQLSSVASRKAMLTIHFLSPFPHSFSFSLFRIIKPPLFFPPVQSPISLSRAFYFNISPVTRLNCRVGTQPRIYILIRDPITVTSLQHSAWAASRLN